MLIGRAGYRTGRTVERFVCRANARAMYEDDGALHGVGVRAQGRTKTVSARIYDKTVEMREEGGDTGMTSGADAYDPTARLFGVEFEFGPGALRVRHRSTQTRRSRAPESAVEPATTEWLSLRVPRRDDHEDHDGRSLPSGNEIRRARLVDRCGWRRAGPRGPATSTLRRHHAGISRVPGHITAACTGRRASMTRALVPYLLRSFEYTEACGSRIAWHGDSVNCSCDDSGAGLRTGCGRDHPGRAQVAREDD